MRPLMRLVLGIVVLIAMLAGVALALPSQVAVQRFIVINAPEAAVFPYLNNLHKFKDWSPWAARDEQIRVSYAGPETGKGAHTEWTSDKKAVGAGRMDITGSDPNHHVDLDVSFNGLEGKSYYEVTPFSAGSKVTWGFNYDTGTNPLRRWKGLMLDRFLGTDYHDGLARLKERIDADRGPLVPAASVPAAPPAGTVPPAGPAPALPGQAQPGPGGQTVVPEAAPQAATTPAPPDAAAPKPAKKQKQRQ